MAGPSDRAGFIDAPVIGPPNIASSATVPPIAIAAPSPTARVSVATAMITNIRKKVSTPSHRKAWPSEPDGSVAPTWATSPSEPRRTQAAASRTGELRRPVAGTRGQGKCRVSANAQRHRRVEVRAGDVPDRVDHDHDHQPEADRDADVAELVASSRRP